MKTIRTTLKDNHSGESAWEGEMITISVPDNIFEKIDGKYVLWSGFFINALWNDQVVSLLDDRIAVDGLCKSYVCTEPSFEELKTLPWKNIDPRYDIIFDSSKWIIKDQSGNISPVFTTNY